MQAYTAIAITMLILVIGRGFWLYAARRGREKRQGNDPIATDTDSALLFSDTSVEPHGSNSSADDSSSNSTGRIGGNDARGSGD